MRTIGVFDSGVGGISVLKEILKEFPNDNIIYFGDSLHAPYGDRSIEEIRRLCLKVSDFLVFDKEVDALVIACNTATGAAINIMQERYNIPVVGVVDNGVNEAINSTSNNLIGIIATPATVKMNIYPNTIFKLAPQNSVFQVECPLFVAMIENGWVDSIESDNLIKSYISKFSENIDTLILGCTHYPLITKYISRYFSGKIVNPAKETSKSLKKIIGDGKENLKYNPSRVFFVSGELQKFKKVAEEFLEQPIEDIRKIIL
ncbi:glutamate racemase [Cetobacterium sp. 8H]|uniref:glutamate racemase n=1 Tax=Cetobacterium sp. 8H TaxID=2759681 RepID=UPI00163CD6EF|nr:glutamate racemase [Cetobacterium sp. 8H]MBC2850062.1 glutamate racemase [Cetobacterium sp. 8H]